MSRNIILESEGSISITQSGCRVFNNRGQEILKLCPTEHQALQLAEDLIKYARFKEGQ